MIGGLALSAWVEPRTTKDVDLVVVVSQSLTWKDIASLIKTRLGKKLILQKGNKKTTIHEKLSFMIGHIEVDLISTKGFVLAAEAVAHALTAEVFDKSVKVAIPEYLILLKLLPLSLQDEVDIRALMKKADPKRLKTLAERHSLLPKLEPLLIQSREKR